MASSFWNGDFYFDDVLSSTYKVCIIDFNSSDILKQTGGGFSISTEKDTSYNNRPFYRESERKMENIILQLCRTDGKPWKFTDIVDINNWLFKKNFKKFQPTDFSNQGYNVIYYLKAIEMKKFLDPSMTGYLEITFQSYDGYAYIIPQTQHILNPNESRIINNMSNVDDVYYPKIRIINNGSENTNIAITNNTNGKSLEILGMSNNENIIIDCAIGSVVDSKGINRFSVLQNYDFIGLERGNNTISLSGNASVEFICEFPIIM